MLDNWITPPQASPGETFGLSPHMFGQTVHTDLDARNGCKVLGLVGLDPKWAHRVRRHLYRFAAGSSHNLVFDLGDFRRMQPEFVVHATRALAEADICPVIIGSSGEINRAVLQMAPDLQKTTVSIVFHESVPGWAHTTHKAVRTYLMGVQQHILDSRLATVAEASGTEIQRLGYLRDNLEDAEPEIRDASVVTMDLSCIRVADLPGQSCRSSSGFTTEEGCRLMRYAGQATGLKAMLISGHDPRSVHFDLSANTTAQLLWYFIDAFRLSYAEIPRATEHFQRYVLHIDDHNLDLIYYKSQRTGRWWVEIPVGKEHLMFSCGYNDYQLACEGKVSERIIRCIQQSLQHCEQPL